MTRRIGVAILAATLVFGGSVAIASAAGPSRAALQKPQTGEAREFGARRRVRHHHRSVNQPIYRPSYYYDRPRDYAPAPFFPFLGLGYGPWW